MPQAFVATLVAFGLGMLLGAACGAAGVVWGHEAARTHRVRMKARKALEWPEEKR